jgi:L-Ala-D/L-Glu epimerase
MSCQTTLHFRPYRVPLRHPFGITHGVSTEQENVLVELRCPHTGLSGYGEAAPSLAYPDTTVATILAALERVRTVLERFRWETPEQLWEEMVAWLGEHDRFALCGIDLAAHDLWAKRLGQPTWAAWGLEWSQTPVSNYTIGIDTIDRMVAKIQEFPGWPIYKIKLGTGDDLEIVRALRQHTDAIFRLDANTGWTAAQTLEFAPVMKELGVEFLEQPMPADAWLAMQEIKDLCALPLIADESCHTLPDVLRCSRSFHGINLKLTKAGGLTEARRMIAEARRLGIRVMAGCMKESTVGIGALAQLLPLLDAVDMDGALLLAQDIATGITLDRGVCARPDLPGNGFQILSNL